MATSATLIQDWNDSLSDEELSTLAMFLTDEALDSVIASDGNRLLTRHAVSERSFRLSARLEQVS